MAALVCLEAIDRTFPDAAARPGSETVAGARLRVSHRLTAPNTVAPHGDPVTVTSARVAPIRVSQREGNGTQRSPGCWSRNRWVVWPGDGIGRVGPDGGPDVSQEFADDSGVPHGPASSWLEVAGSDPILVVRPPGAVTVHRGASGEVIDEYGREVEADALLGVQVGGQCEHPSGAAATAAVVPEAGAHAPR